ncbi:MAG: ribosomal L7Ae/L30e/S12e/Gadd45 family protein [Clostridia bacterium]|nr:ribosomal L7Ae/L30e/S12e/Gadd45 family protein [Clostridia bacterium]
MRAGHHNMVVGVRQSKRVIEEGRVQIAYLAEDADSFVSVPFIEICKVHNVRLEYVPTKSALGRMCHIDVPAAVAVELKPQD